MDGTNVDTTTVSYNTVNLSVIKTIDFRKTMVRTDDEVNYLWTHYRAEYICQIHPKATAFRLQAGSLIAGGPSDPDISPGETLNAIQSKLRVPRGRLRIFNGDIAILDSPSAGVDGSRLPCDARGDGPSCKVIAIKQVIGLKHMIAHVVFEACVRDCTNEATVPVIGNQYEIQEDIDELGYPTRTIMGEIILRADWMRQNQWTADQFRDEFMFPLPNNYQRDYVNCRLSSDGTRLKYLVRDVGKCYNIGATLVETGGFLKMEGYRNAWVTVGAPLRFAAQAAQQAQQGVANNWMFGPWALLWQGMQTPGRAFEAGMRNLPQYHFSVRVDLWGERNSVRRDLTMIAFGICLHQFNNNFAAFTIGAMDLVVRQALHEKFVSVEMTWRWSDDLNAAMQIAMGPIPLGAFGAGAGILQLLTRFLDNDRTLDGAVWAPGEGSVLDQTGAQPRNPTIQNTRGAEGLATNDIGNRFAHFITELLLAPCERPSVPGERYSASATRNS